MLEVEAPVPLGRAERRRRRTQREEQPLLVIVRRLEVVALVAHESDRRLRDEKQDESDRRERDGEAAAHGAVVHADRQNGRSVSRALIRNWKACSPAGARRSSRRHPDSAGTVGGTKSSASGAPSTRTSTRTGPRAA